MKQFLEYNYESLPILYLVTETKILRIDPVQVANINHNIHDCKEIMSSLGGAKVSL